MAITPIALPPLTLEARVNRLLNTERETLNRSTDNLFLNLLLLQGVIGFIMAVKLSCAAQDGSGSEAFSRTVTIAVAGGSLAAIVAGTTMFRPGMQMTRYVIAVAQMLCCALFAYLTGSSHDLYVYGSLAVLAFYRDWRVLAIAAGMIFIGHSLEVSWTRVASASDTLRWWHSANLTFYTAIEAVVLFATIRQSLKQSWASARSQAERDQQHASDIEAKQADLEKANGLLETSNRLLANQMAEHHAANRASQESEQRYRRMVELSPLACLVIKYDVITFANQPCIKMLRATDLGQLLGTSLLPLIDEEHRSAFAERMSACQRNEGTLLSVSTMLKCLDGVLKEVEVSAFTFSERNSLCLQVFIHDISERVRLEAQNRLKQKYEVTGQLAGGIAHDFNNLLAVILGCCHFLKDDAAISDASQELIDDISKAGNRAAALTKQLLAHSRQQVLQTSVINLNDIVTEAAGLLERVIGEDIILSCNTCNTLWPVNADGGQIHQVLMNLAVNARDAMPQGGRLTLQTSNVVLDTSQAAENPDAEPGEYVMLSVSDTGCGIAPETKSRIFEPFFTTKEVGKGTGLGLATVLGIVKQSGGHITVSSEEGLGSTFKVYLPKCESQTASVAHCSSPRPRSAGATILVVEDEAGVRKLICRVLRSEGYQVLEADSGEDALRVLAAHQGPVHLVITDVVMPGMGGGQLRKLLLESRPEIRVLHMSGYMNDAVMRHGVSQTEPNFLQKPFSYEELACAVSKTLEQLTEDSTAPQAFESSQETHLLVAVQ